MPAMQNSDQKQQPQPAICSSSLHYPPSSTMPIGQNQMLTAMLVDIVEASLHSPLESRFEETYPLPRLLVKQFLRGVLGCNRRNYRGLEKRFATLIFQS